MKLCGSGQELTVCLLRIPIRKNMQQESWYKGEITLVGARTFTIELRERDKDNQLSEAKTTLVSRQNPRLRVPLPVPPPTEDIPFDFNRFFVSPDEDTIIASRKVAHGTNEMRVFHRVRGLRYVPAEKQSLNDRIGKKFGLPWKHSGNDEQSVDIIRFQRWEAGGRHAILGCMYIGQNNKKEYYFVTLDVRTGALSYYARTQEDKIQEPS